MEHPCNRSHPNGLGWHECGDSDTPRCEPEWARACPGFVRRPGPFCKHLAWSDNGVHPCKHPEAGGGYFCFVQGFNAGSCTRMEPRYYDETGEPNRAAYDEAVSGTAFVCVTLARLQRDRDEALAVLATLERMILDRGDGTYLLHRVNPDNPADDRYPTAREAIEAWGKAHPEEGR